jgi:Cu2+-exporting ATPase
MTNFETLPGRGARATVNGQVIAVGGPRMIADANVSVTPELDKTANVWASDGKTVLYVIQDSSVVGALAVEDEIRPESAEAITALHKLGVRVAMITGDSQAVADSVARRLGIDEVAAQVLPADKASAVERFQPEARRWQWSAMVSTMHQRLRRRMSGLPSWHLQGDSIVLREGAVMVELIWFLSVCLAS